MKAPIVREIGRYQITGAETQGRVIREMIENKKINGWDDPHLVTVKALRRRGFVPEMFQELAQTVGLSKSSGHIDPTVLAAANRKIIDSRANRYFFVSEPVELIIKNKPEIKEVKIPVHPDFPDKKRKVSVGGLFVSLDDAKKLSNTEIRLLHLYNIKLGDKITDKKINAIYTSSEIKNIPKLHWVSSGLPAKILMPDGTWKQGLAEPGIKQLKPGDIIQFERFAFCRYDKLDKGVYEFWFSHP